MKTKKSKTAIIVSAIILAIVLALNIAVGALSGLIDKWVIGYKDNGSSSVARTEGAALVEQIQGEGSILVQNNDNLLPMTTTDVPKVNVFGWAATDWVISGSGSGQVKRVGATDLLGALTEYGIEYNQGLIDMYEGFRPNREFSIMGGNGGKETDGNPGTGSLHSFNYEFSRLYEPSINDKDFYSDSLLQEASAYSDTAIVVIGRTSGESNDSPKVQYKETTGKGTGAFLGKGVPDADHTDTTRTYLEISTEEEELLNYVGTNYENVIVLINSTNVMELGFMETIDGLDSCLIVATTGTAGAKAIPRMLYSDITDAEGNNISISPSGRTADTYAYDLSTSSTYLDVGSGNDTTNFYTNGAGLYPTNVQHTNGSSNVPYEGVAFTDYREGIYMGYKWYETADAEGFWDTEYAKNKWGITKGYEEVVQYPFGFGMSYTEFEWEILYLDIVNNSTVTADDVIKVGVRVHNVGDYPGQDVVQLYYSAEYTAGGIEKAAVNLGAFGKTTEVIPAGESRDVVLEMKVSDMASYDYEEKIIPGGGYVLEEGQYKISLRRDAHTPAGSILRNSGAYGNDTITYRIASDTRVDEAAENRFTGTDTTDGVAIDGNSDGSAEITYLTRGDFANTFPGERTEDRAMTDEIMALNLYTAEMADAWKAEHSDAASVTFGDTTKGQIVGETKTADDGTKYYELNDYGIQLGLDYNDPEWEKLLDRITKEEMTQLVLHGYAKTSAVASINKPATLDYDGPNQIGSFANINNKTGFSSIVLAQTWNVDLAYSMGLTFGAECAEAGVTGWYGPGVNLHRSPFGGRNYEYYSEDTLISGLMCANVVEAAKNRGVFCWLKHICLYESESGRDGMYTWLTEQALRELYLKPFEIAVKEGGSTAIMTSYGRIGAVWTGGSEALLTEVVRGEWGFKGSFLTDYADHHDFMNGDQMVRAGGDIWMDGYQNNGSFKLETSSAAFDQALRSASKNVIYTWMNALATNADYNAKIASGEIEDTIVVPNSPELNFRWYIPVLIGIDVAAVVGCGLWLFFALRKKDEAAA